MTPQDVKQARADGYQAGLTLAAGPNPYAPPNGTLADLLSTTDGRAALRGRMTSRLALARVWRAAYLRGMADRR